MSKRDVELVIAAQDRASKAVETVAEALRKLEAAQKKTAEGAADVGGLLGKLGAALGSLESKVAGLRAFGAVAKELDTAGKAIARLESEAGDTAAKLQSVEQRSTRLAGSQADLQQKLEATERALARQNATLRSAAAERDRLANATAKVSDRLREAQERQLRGDGRIDADTSRLQRVVERLNASLADARQRVARGESAIGPLEGQLKEYQAQIRTAIAEQQRLGVEAGKIGARYAEQAGGVNAAREAFRALQAESERLRAALGTNAQGVQAVGVEAQNAVARIGELTAALKRLQAAQQAAKSVQAVNEARLPQEVQAVQNFARQRTETEGLRQAFAEARAEASRLAEQMRATTQPTAELAAATAQARARALEAGVAYQQSAERTARLAATLSQTQAAQAAARREQERASIAAFRTNEILLRKTTTLTRVAAAYLRVGSAAGKVSLTMRQVGDGTRQTLSLMQRLRGEVLSVTAATIGLYQAFSQIGGVIRAFREFEAAESRLGAVFDQDFERVGREIRFVEAQADRLGISFETLAAEYSKLAIAAKASNFSAEGTREIFLSIAEAGRVLKLSGDQVTGTFLAITQMMSKGKVTSEELRRQLGDRLYGAFILFADAIGVTGAELDEMLRKGEVFSDEDTLLKFARRLTQEFGGQLPTALQASTTQLDRLQNSFFQARLTVARSGFLEELTKAVIELNKALSSDEGRRFLQGIGQALGAFSALAASAIRNAELLSIALSAVAGQVIARSFARLQSNMVGSFTVLRTGVAEINRLKVAFNGLNASMLTTIPSFRVFKFTLAGIGVRALGALSVTIRALIASLGGLKGILLTVVATAFIEWMFRSASASERMSRALESGQKTVTRFSDALADSKTEAEGLAKALENVSEVELETSLRRAQEGLAEYLKSQPGFAPVDLNYDAVSTLGLQTGSPEWQQFRLQAKAVADELRALDEQQRRGEITSREYKRRVEEIAEAFKFLSTETIGARLDAANSAIEFEQEVEKVEAALAVLRGTATDTQRALFPLAEGVEDTGDAFKGALKDVEAYTKALDELRSKIPALQESIERSKELNDIYANIDAGLAAAGNNPGARRRVLQAGAAAIRETSPEMVELRKIADNIGVSIESLLEIVGREGLRTQAYQVPGEDFYTIGIGDTGRAYSGRRPTAGMQISSVDAVRDFGLNLAGFKREIEELVTVPLTEAMRSALLSVQFNTGGLGSATGRATIIDPLNRGDYFAAAQGIRGFRRAAPSGIDLGSRRDQESDAFLSGGLPEGELRAQRQRELAERTERQREFNAAIAEETRQRERQAELLAAEEREALILSELDARRAEAAREGVSLSEAQETAIRQSVGALFDAEQAQARLLEQQQALEDFARAADERSFETGVATLDPREQEILRAIREEQVRFQEVGLDLGAERIRQIREEVGALYDLQNADRLRAESIQRIEDSIRQLEERRSLILEQIEFERERGNTFSEEQLVSVLGQVNEQLREAIDKAIQFYTEMGGPEAENAVLRLELLRQQVEATGVTADLTARQIADTMSSSITSAFVSLGQAIGEGENSIKSMGKVFAETALNIVSQLSEMVVRAILFRQIMAAIDGAGASGGFNFGMTFGDLFHGGGVVGQGNRRRMVDPSWFATAQRYHNGGIVGLKPREVPIIAERGERVLTAEEQKSLGGMSVSVSVDARDAQSPVEVEARVRRAMRDMLPAMENTVLQMRRKGKI